MGGDAKQKNELKILSYNVQLFGVYKSSLEKSLATRNTIFTFLRKENADIICLQEYYRKDKPTRFETLDSLYSIIGSENYHERSAYKKVGNQNFGIAMFSKYPMIAKGDVIFDSQSSTDFNYCIYSDIVKNNDTFRIYNVHLQCTFVMTIVNVHSKCSFVIIIFYLFRMFGFGLAWLSPARLGLALAL